MAMKLDPAQTAGGEVVSVENDDLILFTHEPPFGKLPRDHPDRVAARERRAKLERQLSFREATDRLEVAGGVRRGGHLPPEQLERRGQDARAHLPRGLRCVARRRGPHRRRIRLAADAPGRSAAGVRCIVRRGQGLGRLGLAARAQRVPVGHPTGFERQRTAEIGGLALEQGRASGRARQVDPRRRRLAALIRSVFPWRPLPRGGGHPPHFPRMNAYRSA